MSKNIEGLKGQWLASNPDYTFNIMLKILEDFEKRLKAIEIKLGIYTEEEIKNIKVSGLVELNRIKRG